MAAIRITAGNTSTGDLTLQDIHGKSATNYHAQSGEIITWEIQPHSGVNALTGFPQKNVIGNQDVFSSGPAKQSNSSIWQGTVKHFGQDQSGSDSYEISWQDADGNSYTYDPMILVNILVK